MNFKYSEDHALNPPAVKHYFPGELIVGVGFSSAEFRMGKRWSDIFDVIKETKRQTPTVVRYWYSTFNINVLPNPDPPQYVRTETYRYWPLAKDDENYGRCDSHFMWPSQTIDREYGHNWDNLLWWDEIYKSKKKRYTYEFIRCWGANQGIEVIDGR